jgi:hypothetical protein
MVAKITIGSSLFGAIKYNADKVNEGKGQLLDTNRVYNAGNGKVDVAQVLQDFERWMPLKTRTEKPVLHVSLNPHPEDKLTDSDLTSIAHEYMERMGYGDQPYIIVKHEDIDRHHIHIVSVRVNEQGKCVDKSFNYLRSKRITRDIEREYGLHPADKKQERQSVNPLHPVNSYEGNIKKQVGNTVKAVFHDYQFQTIGELRALLSLYNLTVEEVRGNVRGVDYNGLIYSVNDADGNKVGNPFKSSLFGKSVGYEAMQKKAAFLKKNIKDKNLTEPTRKALEYTLKRTYDKDEFVRMLKERGIDCVFRYTDEGRIYGATFIDHRTHCVLNGSRMGKAFSANALEQHFNTPSEEQIPFKEKEKQEEQPNTGSTSAEGQQQSTSYDEQEHYESKGGFASFLDALDILNTDNPVTDAEEEAFRHRLQRKKKKRRGPRL